MLEIIQAIETDEDKGKFLRLYSKYRTMILYVAAKYDLKKQDAEDIMQNVWLAIMDTKLARIDESNEVATKNFIYIMTKHRAIDHLRAEKRHWQGREYEIDIDQITPEDMAALDNDRIRAIVTEIYKLPPLYKDILYLNIVLEYKGSEIARMLQLNYDMVKKRIQRGKEMLIKQLEINEDFDWLPR